jgi:hypothetical protein
VSRKFSLWIFTTGFLILFSISASAQKSIKRVSFAKGTTEAAISGTIRRYEFRDYLIRARAGQTISVKLNSKNTFTVFTIFTPDGNNLEGAAEMDDYDSAALPANGDYKIRVLMMRAEARRRNSVANFSLRISVR